MDFTFKISDSLTIAKSLFEILILVLLFFVSIEPNSIFVFLVLSAEILMVNNVDNPFSLDFKLSIPFKFSSDSF